MDEVVNVATTNQTDCKECRTTLLCQKRDLKEKFHTISFPSREPDRRVSETESQLNLDQSSANKTKPSKIKQWMKRRIYVLSVRFQKTEISTHDKDKDFQEKDFKLVKKGKIRPSLDSVFPQSPRNPVVQEAGTNSRPSSLSSDVLDEAEAALQKDVGVACEPLQAAGAVPSDLEPAENQANSGDFREDGSLTTEVELRGTSAHTDRLEETLHDVQMNHVVNLPHPDMVDCFDKVLHMIHMKQTEVTMNASSTPYPCVLLSGPRCEVQEVQASLTSILASFTLDTFILEGPWALQYFQGDGRVNMELIEKNCHVIIKAQGVNPGTCTARNNINPIPRVNFNTVRTNVSTNVVNKPRLEIKIGNLEDEQANVLVVPMLNRQINSTNIGNCLVKKGGGAMTSNFNLMASYSFLGPGDVLQVDAPLSLNCSKLFFIECLPWDGVRGKSGQALSQGLKRCLDLCEQQQLHSVAFPVIGPGMVLKFPLSEAIQVLTDTIRQFGSSTSSGSLSNIRVVIKQDNPDSSKFYHDIYRHLSSDMNQGGQAIFHSLTSDLDDITMTVGGGIKLQLVFGDITNETTDAVVNTTDFVNLQIDGVCKDILAIAGPTVKAKLKAGEDRAHSYDIFKQLISQRLTEDDFVMLSAAKVSRGEIFQTQPGFFPCKGILHIHGQKDANLIEQIVCRIIEKCETSGFTSVAIPAICTDQHSLQITPMSQNSTFLFMGLTRKDVDDAKIKLKDLFQAHTLSKEELGYFTAEDLKNLEDLADTYGLLMLKDQPSQGCLTVSGMQEGVNLVRQMITTFLHSALKRQASIRSQEDLYNRVTWCILGTNGNWERLPQKANHNLENRDITDGIEDAQGASWRVDLQRSEATCPASGRKATLKRLENLSDFTLPLYWDNMAAGENMKTFELQPSSPEYKRVKEAFKRTVTKTVLKIQRVQNIHLRHAYEVQKKGIDDKNRTKGGEFEMFLYHGTTQDNCTSIMNTGFNRSFAGQNATLYGQGTYFAVNANYSAQPTYSKPLADGSQLMFVARVLTGIYGQGSAGMKVPPPRSDQQPHDLCDSVVDKMDKPNMFVVFHDDQAYPDYLITFK
ncbi:uncharacterized protein V6R79_010317 [Siganus canaliculatus]